MTWKEFLSRHFEQIAATDFFTVQVWTLRGLQRLRIFQGRHVPATDQVRRLFQRQCPEISGGAKSRQQPLYRFQKLLRESECPIILMSPREGAS
jgi:hypothetical protein